MKIEWRCACGKKLSAPPERAGKKIACPRCAKRQVVPALAGGGETTEVVGPDAPNDATRLSRAPAAAGENLPPDSAGLGERYAVSGEISRGGMGIILDGTDRVIRRELAIKVLASDGPADPERVARFVEEAQVQGQLEHPNICPIHDLGTDGQGRPYFTMKKVRGRSLGEVLEELARHPRWKASREFTLSRLLGVLVKVCDAVAYAHSAGVLHRDLKPANVMIGSFGEVLVMDWGLAKVRGRPDRPEAIAVRSDRVEVGSHKTLEGRVMGTPAYMPPEQATGLLEELDERSDVYSLGAILYTMLTLQPPVSGRDLRQVLDRVRRNEIRPPPLAAPERAIPRDLSAAAMKALAGEKSARYPSVEAFQADIEAFLEGRTLEAARYGPLQVAAKWVRRNKVFAATASVAAALLLAASGFYVASLKGALDETRREAERARKAETAASEEAERAGRAEQEARMSLEKADAGIARDLAQRAEMAWERRDALETEAFLIRSLLHDDRPEVRRRFLAVRSVRPELLWASSALGSQAPIAASADGRRFAWVDSNGVVRVQETRTAREVFSTPAADPGSPALLMFDVTFPTALSPDGRRVAWGTPLGLVEVRDAEGGGEALRWQAHEDEVKALAFSPDGERLASTGEDGRTRLWDARDGAPDAGDEDVTVWARPAATAGTHEALARLLVDGGKAARSAVTGDGTKLLAWYSSALAVWDVEKVRQESLLRGHTAPLAGVAVSADGSRVATADNAGTILVWGGERGDLLRAISREETELVDLALSPDGRLVAAAGSEGAVDVLDTGTGRSAARLEEHAVGELAVAFSPDGKILATGDGSGNLRTWDPATGKLVSEIDAGPYPILEVVFHSLGDYLAVRTERSVATYRLDEAGAQSEREFRPGEVGAIAVCPLGPLVAAVVREIVDEDTPLLEIWETGDEELDRTIQPPFPARALAFGPGSRILASGHDDGAVRLWDWRTGALVVSVRELVEPVVSLAWSADGRRLVAGGESGSVRVFAMDRTPAARVLRGPAFMVADHVAFRPDSRQVAARWGSVRLLDVESGRVERTLPLPAALGLVALAYLEDGVLAAATTRGECHAWDPSTGAELEGWKGGTDAFKAAAFSPDGSHVAVGTESGPFLWIERATGREIFRLGEADRPVTALAVSPDGRMLGIGTDIQGIGVLDLVKPDLVLGREEGSARAIAFSGDSRRLAAVGGSRVLVIDLGTGEVVREWANVPGEPETVTFTRDGRVLAVAGEDGVVRRWDVETGGPLPHLEGHVERVGDLAASPDGRWLASSSDDGSVRLWDLPAIERCLAARPEELRDELSRTTWLPREGLQVESRSGD